MDTNRRLAAVVGRLCTQMLLRRSVSLGLQSALERALTLGMVCPPFKFGLGVSRACGIFRSRVLAVPAGSTALYPTLPFNPNQSPQWEMT